MTLSMAVEGIGTLILVGLLATIFLNGRGRGISLNLPSRTTKSNEARKAA